MVYLQVPLSVFCSERRLLGLAPFLFLVLFPNHGILQLQLKASDLLLAYLCLLLHVLMPELSLLERCDQPEPFTLLLLCLILQRCNHSYNHINKYKCAITIK